MVRVHANRLRKIPKGVVETVDPKDGVFPDSLRTLDPIAGKQVRKNKESGEMERRFKERISGSRSSCWTPESDLPTAVVKLYDSRDGVAGTRRAMTPTQPDNAGLDDGADEEAEDTEPNSVEDAAEDEAVAEVVEMLGDRKRVTWADRKDGKVVE